MNIEQQTLLRQLEYARNHLINLVMAWRHCPTSKATMDYFAAEADGAITDINKLLRDNQWEGDGQ